jgi:hypothetical protein
MKEKILIFLSVANLAAVALLGFIFLLGAAATMPALAYNHLFQIAIIGYLIAAISGLLSFRKKHFLWLVLLGWSIFFIANKYDSKNIAKDNEETCRQLRADPTCVEDACGFKCEKVTYIRGSICKDKDMDLCQAKTKQDAKDESDTQDALKVYSGIVDKIIASPAPANENFENQLVAIYNCFEKKYGPGAEGEQKAIQVLREKNLTAQQLDKYYSYHASKGRNITPGMLVAGLPGGDKNLSCEYINVK